jgi:hypothetical protein
MVFLILMVYHQNDERDTIMSITDTTIRNTKPAGGKYWRMQYRFAGKQKTLAFGVYPTIGLKEARERRDEARKLLANGADPGAVKKAQKTAKLEMRIHHCKRHSRQAIAGEEVILGPYEPIDDYFVAIINDAGAPVELIQTSLSDAEIWGRAKRGEGSLYRPGNSFNPNAPKRAD